MRQNRQDKIMCKLRLFVLHNKDITYYTIFNNVMSCVLRVPVFNYHLFLIRI
jgi:hypothetical protein